MPTRNVEATGSVLRDIDGTHLLASKPLRAKSVLNLMKLSHHYCKGCYALADICWHTPKLQGLRASRARQLTIS